MRAGLLRIGAATFAMALAAVWSSPVAAQVPAAVDSLAGSYVERHEVPGMAVAWVAAESQGVWTAGVRCAGEDAPVTEMTGFEIGSITKALVGTLLAIMVEAGEVAIDAPIASLLPDTVPTPSAKDHPITLRHLVTHTSGLPRLPANLRPPDPANPYADYGLSELYQYLGRAPLMHAPGSAYLYSNIGHGLLGVALGRRVGASLDEAIRGRVLGPLGMPGTYLPPPAGEARDRKAETACGHQRGTPTTLWTWDALAGAGAARSTAYDMLRFIRAQVDPGPHSMGPAIRRSQIVLARPGGTMSLAYGWHLLGDTDDSGSLIYLHNGGTGGFRSIVAFSPGREAGVAILVNEAVPGPTLDALGLEILRSLATSPIEG